VKKEKIVSQAIKEREREREREKFYTCCHKYNCDCLAEDYNELKFELALETYIHLRGSF
jgi:hypothetical protein